MLNNISATVLIVEDLDKCMTFYQDIFGLEALFTDDVSAAYKMGNQDFVILKTSAAAEMVGEGVVFAGNQTMLCIAVEDVDVTYKELTSKGVVFLKPPKSQHWGRRTAYFADPEGNLWELWHSLPDGE